MKFKKGQKVRLLVHGAGVTSEEEAVVTCVSGHSFWLNHDEPNKDAAFSLDTGKRKGVFGFSFEVLTKGDEAKMAVKKKKVTKKKSVKKLVKRTK